MIWICCWFGILGFLVLFVGGIVYFGFSGWETGLLTWIRFWFDVFWLVLNLVALVGL